MAAPVAEPHRVPVPKPSAHEALLARHRAVLPSWLALYYDHPISLVCGRGRRVTDAEGTTYLDLFGGILTTLIGHDIPELTDAIATQAARIVHTSTLYLIEPMIELAEEIAARSGIEDARVFFTTSGSEANEAALLLACNHRRSAQVLAVRNSYHGRSFATMGVTGNRGWSPTALSPFSVSWVASGYRFRSPFRHLADDDDAFTAACVEDLVDVLATCTSGDVACLIAEPVQGIGGVAVPPPGFLGAYQDVLGDHGALVISDEVQTGWGRTGDDWWGYPAQGLRPDLLTFAKGVGNGLPLAGVVGRAEIVDDLATNSISTFGGGPMVSAVGLATVRYVIEHDLVRHAAAMGERFDRRLAPLADTFAGIAEVRGRGLMIGIEVVDDDGWTPSAARAAALLEDLRTRGVLVGRGGLHGNCLRITPPLTITAEEVDEGAAAVVGAAETVLG